MNAKKLILLGASAMLLASCGQSLTRAEAIEMMDGISKKTGLTSDKLTYVKELKEKNETGATGKTTYVFDGSNASYVVDAKKGEETVKGSAVIVKKDAAYTVTLDDGSKKEYFTISAESNSIAYATVDNTLGNIASASIATHIANGLNHAKKDNKYGYCGFLNRFPEGKEPITGGSFRNDAHIEAESYVKNGEGSISCSYNAYYETQGDEVMKAEWKDYFLVAKSNAKTSSTGYGFETWDYKKGGVSANTNGYTELTSSTDITALAVKVAACFA
ncbi:MAG: hypothetical protein J6038_01550 [Bacilli bacterium]|nr:hypothetical protein [Bacilli bacterium]